MQGLGFCEDWVLCEDLVYVRTGFLRGLGLCDHWALCEGLDS
jgi:hypothetical protein